MPIRIVHTADNHIRIQHPLGRADPRSAVAVCRGRRRHEPGGERPGLVALRDAFDVRLRRAQDDANATLEGLLSSGLAPLIRPVDLQLSSQELAIEALLAEIRAELMGQTAADSRVRIV